MDRRRIGTQAAPVEHPGSNTDNIELPGGTGDLLKRGMRVNLS